MASRTTAHAGSRLLLGSGPALRVVAALVAFVVIGLIAVAAVGNFTTADAQANSLPLVVCLALVGAGLAYGGVEMAQTGEIASVARQFQTRTLALMPFAIALNIVVGAIVGDVLKVPVYFDSVGTILVAALAGPVAGALTGVLADVLWQYVFQGGTSAAFSLTASVIGLLAGLAARYGIFRPRPEASTSRLLAGGGLAVVIVLGLAGYSFTRFYAGDLNLFTGDPVSPALDVLGVLVLLAMLAGIVGLLVLLLVGRDLGVAYVVVAGALTGFVAGSISAPVAAGLFGGVTGSGTDFLVALFRAQGAGVLAATFEQSLLSDPVDKMLEFLLAYVILRAISRRVLARFPQGPDLLPRSR